jgi:hypothetical protein
VRDDWRSPSATFNSNSDVGSNSSGHSDTESEDLNDSDRNSTDGLDLEEDASDDEPVFPTVRPGLWTVVDGLCSPVQSAVAVD